jgi:hypothetical protein
MNPDDPISFIEQSSTRHHGPRRGSNADSCENPRVPIQPSRIRFLILVAALVAFVVGAQLVVRKISTGPLRALVEENLTQVPREGAQ